MKSDFLFKSYDQYKPSCSSSLYVIVCTVQETDGENIIGKQIYTKYYHGMYYAMNKKAILAIPKLKIIIELFLM